MIKSGMQDEGSGATPTSADFDFKDVVAAYFAYRGLVKHALLENRVGLSKSQALFLTTVKELGIANMTTLSQRMGMSKEHITRTVQSLVECGYLRRSHDEANRRIVNVSLTDKGLFILEDHFAAVNELLEQKLAGLSASEQARLIEASRIATRLLCQVQGDHCPCE